MTFVLVSVLYKHVCECIDDPFATPVTDATVYTVFVTICVLQYYRHGTGYLRYCSKRAGTGFLAKTVYGTGTGTTFIITTEPVPVLQPFCRLPVPAL